MLLSISMVIMHKEVVTTQMTDGRNPRNESGLLFVNVLPLAGDRGGRLLQTHTLIGQEVQPVTLVRSECSI